MKYPTNPYLHESIEELMRDYGMSDFAGAVKEVLTENGFDIPTAMSRITLRDISNLDDAARARFEEDANG